MVWSGSDEPRQCDRRLDQKLALIGRMGAEHCLIIYILWLLSLEYGCFGYMSCRIRTSHARVEKAHKARTLRTCSRAPTDQAQDAKTARENEFRGEGGGRKWRTNRVPSPLTWVLV